jgi:hypothetical protein
MAADPSIVFFHTGGIPRYLRATLESARYFNPDAAIVLITDQRPDGLDRMRINVRKLDQLRSPKGDEFYGTSISRPQSSIMKGIASVGGFISPISCSRKGIPAWSIWTAMPCCSMTRASCSRSCPPDRTCSAAKATAPAVTFIQHSLDPLLDLILAKYRDGKFLEEARERRDAAVQAGAMVNLTDMNFIEMLVRAGGGLGASYPNDLPIGHIDHCIFGSGDGMITRPDRRHVARKRVFWRDDGRTFKPYFRRATDGQVVPALAIHFQNGAKRRIRRFNRLGSDSRLPRSVRLRYYEWLLN